MYFAAMKMCGVGQINQLLWSAEMSVRPEPAEKERWDAWLDSGAQWKGKQREQKVKSKQRSEIPHLAAGCYGLEELHLRALSKPLKSVCL